jgi:hypothetical protein
VSKAGQDVGVSGARTLSFGAGSDLAIALNGTAVDAEYEQLNVVGEVDLTGVDLALALHYTPVVGDAFVIVANDASEAVIGAFNGLPEGAVFRATSGGLDAEFAITYQGGDGNDVVLTAINTAPTFVAGADATATDESGLQTIAVWATSISPGLPGEAGQPLHFAIAGNTNPALFAAGPEIDAIGTLTFTPAPNAAGTAEITIVLQDDGGTAHDGSDSSGPQTFSITIAKPHPWHNTRQALDVIGAGGQPDGIVAPADALAIINYINARGSGAIPADAVAAPPYLDTTGGPDGQGDNSVVPADALAVINYLNASGTGQSEPAGEGEAPLPLPARPVDTVLAMDEFLALLLSDAAPAPGGRRRA